MGEQLHPPSPPPRQVRRRLFWIDIFFPLFSFSFLPFLPFFFVFRFSLIIFVSWRLVTPLLLQEMQHVFWQSDE